MASNVPLNIEKMSLLVVDDMGSMRDLVCTIMKEIGFSKISTACNGREACQMIAQKKFDLIVCDWNMPEITGLDVLCKVREKFSKSELPFVMVTAENDRSMVASAIEQGVSDFIVKPFTPDTVMAKISVILNGLAAQTVD